MRPEIKAVINVSIKLTNQTPLMNKSLDCDLKGEVKFIGDWGTVATFAPVPIARSIPTSSVRRAAPVCV